MNISSSAGQTLRLRGLLSHSRRGEAREQSILRLGAHAPALTGCPIDFEQVWQVDSIPDDTADHGEEADEAVGPPAEEGLGAQEEVKQQGGPYLPAHRVGRVAEEVAELEGLLDLFEENLYFPAVAVEVGHGGGRPCKVVGPKLHDHDPAIEIDLGGHPAHAIGVLAAGVGIHEYDLVVGESWAVGLAHPSLDDPQPQVFSLVRVTQQTPHRSRPKRWGKSTKRSRTGRSHPRGRRRTPPGRGHCRCVVASGADDGEAR